MRPKSRLVVALDDVTLERALELAELLPEADALKINYPLVLRHGLESVRKLSKLNTVICDFKVADIDNTNRLIAEAAFEAGAKALIAHAFVGSDSLGACVDVAKRFDGFIIAVVEMSHPGAVEHIQPRTDELVVTALKAGVGGFVAPGTRPARIAHIRELVGDKLIFAPGIGTQGGSARDAVDAGADYVIVGRSIYAAKDPAGTARKIISEVSK